MTAQPGETYGHHPEWTGGGPEDREACVRCTERAWDGWFRPIWRPVAWPCATAVVLAIADRDA